MLDLATAKAENITGLYFARQMNFKATSAVSLTDSAETTPGTQQPGISLEAVKANLADPERSSNGVFEEAGNIKIKVSAPSPIVRRERILTNSGDSLHSTLGGTRLSCPQPATADPSLPPLPGVSNRDVATSKRCRAVTSSETFVSPLFACDDQSTAVEPSFRAESAHAPGSSPASHSAPTRGHHRRSQSASHFFHLSSLKHHSPAQFNLALCYEHGQGGVERDLQMALHFYQQAADQGHTKASYNIGCICYNSGEVSKAMAWFESAGKCSVRGLRTEAAEKLSSSSSDQAPPPLQCPIPKHTSLPHELEDILLGDMAATSGPFAAYLPAILCLALLCRQGVQSRDGTVILERDQEQAIELLQRLLQRTSARSHLGTRGGNSQDATNDMAGSSSSSKTYGDLRKRSSFDVRASAQCPATPGSTTVVPASLATSCPSLPSKQWGVSSGAAYGSATYDPLGRSLAVQETLDGEKDCGHDEASGSGVNSGLVIPTLFSAELQGPDLHEAWSATLALQLLKAWTRRPAERQCEMTATREISLDQKILRHHLLYITNPTHGKNLYNLGVLYDICLGEHLIAARCYESAYRNSRLAGEASCGAHSTLVTRINSAWNLGVIHAKHQEWSQARCWFLKAQQDVLLHAQRQGEQDVKGGGKDHVHRDRTKTHASLVNVIPGNMRYSPSDSPEKARAREHGLMMSFSSLGESSKAGGSARAGKCKRILKKQQHRQAQEGLETDITKVAWVLRWIDSNIKSSA
ncbi:hypothetical protein BGZ68_006824 [Mortierella alpina]|nr:hypothetical protein BGZ68_006824 [Mortierella alpina]